MGRIPTKEGYRNPEKKVERSIQEIANREGDGIGERVRETDTQPGSHTPELTGRGKI